MNFTKQFKFRPDAFRGHNFAVDTRTMTVPDACPTLEEIILSGTQQRVGTPIYDSTFEEGAIRWRVQNAPLDVVLNASEASADDNKRSAAEEKRAERDVMANGSPAAVQQGEQAETPSAEGPKK